LGDKRILMLRNHGPVVLAPTLQMMFLMQWSLQRACEIQMATLSMGQPVVHVPDDVVAVHQRDLGQVSAGGAVGAADFAAWTRRIDKIDRSWRD
jgi:ribulose-5-phosphate 4-epimerase/fuculose-1-phosphate aldolase